MTALAEGTRVGAYRIVRPLGKGGMGAVFEAVHDAIQRHVAIKVLLRQFAEKPEFHARFANEALIANKVDHPGLVQIIDSGQLSDGASYLVMELLRGETLSARLKKAGGTLSLTDAIRFAHLIADCLATAHAHGIVHRDLKPDNVMVVKDPNVPGGERTKVLDFGIAKLADDTDAAQVRTETGAVMGTPAYMSPEQCRGKRDVDARTDVYAFGAMLYKMIAGRPPFEGQNMVELIAQHIFEPPPPLESLVPSVPPQLAALAARMLAKDKEQRPSMEAVKLELEALSESPPASTRRASLPEVPRPGSPTVPLTQIALATKPIVLDNTHVSSPANRPKDIPLRWAVGIGMAMIVGLGATVWLLSIVRGQTTPVERRSEAPIPVVAQPAVVRQVQWTIDSNPSGAQVIDEDGTVLGITPWLRTKPAASGTVTLTLRRTGYQDRSLTLLRDINEQKRLSLMPLPPAKLLPRSRPAPAQPPAPKINPYDVP